MQKMRCKCGEAVCYTSMGRPAKCSGCHKCNTTYAQHPDDHEELQPHEHETRYHQITGKPYKVCKCCGALDQDSYMEARIPVNKPIE